MSVSETEVKKELQSWILKKNPKVSAEALQHDTALMEQKVLSSLHIMDLILFIEKFTGKRTDLTKLKPGAFKSIDAIYQNFFGTSG